MKISMGGWRLPKVQELVKDGARALNGTSLSPADCEDILGEATLSALRLAPDSSDEEISLCFLNTMAEVRKSIASERRRTCPYIPADDNREAWKAFSQLSEESIDSDSGDAEMWAHMDMWEYMLKVVVDLKGFLKIAFDLLKPKDRALIAEKYGFGQVGFVYDPSLLLALSPCARRQALWRARGKFMRNFADVLEEAGKDPHQDKRLLSDVLKLIRSGLLSDALLVCQRHYGKA